MKIGKYKIHFLDSGTFGLDGGAMFGIIPKPLWQKSNPADEQNRVKLAARCLLLESDSKKILVDTGMGNKWEKKYEEIYTIENLDSNLEKSLMQINISSSDITDVILTHLHFDHAGGGVKRENGKLVPAFANAKYFVQEENYKWALSPSDRDKGSYIKDNFKPLIENSVLNFTKGNSNFDDEIEFIVINGHTFGQQLLKISDSSNTLLFSADLLPFVSHIRLPYIMGYDLNPLTTLEEKRKILSIAAKNDWTLIFEHDPFYSSAKVMFSDEGVILKEKFV